MVKGQCLMVPISIYDAMTGVRVRRESVLEMMINAYRRFAIVLVNMDGLSKWFSS